MSWRALGMLSEGEPSGVDAVERALLGAIILSPTVRLEPAVYGLHPNDFRSESRGAVFSVLMALPHPESPLVAQALEERGVPVPQGMAGWFSAISLLLDDPLADDDATVECAKAIRRERIRRQAAARKAS